MTTITIEEAQARLKDLIHKLAPTEVLVITENDKAVATLSIYPTATAPGPPPGWYPGIGSPSAGILADQCDEEDERILEEIQKDRKAPWRKLPE